MLAIENGHYEIADYLVSQGVDMSYPLAHYEEWTLGDASCIIADSYLEAYVLKKSVVNDDQPEQFFRL